MRRLHELCWTADKGALDAAKAAGGGGTVTLNVQWANMPEDLVPRLPTTAGGSFGPRSCDVCGCGGPPSRAAPVRCSVADL
jgi:hypothetical protein